MQAQTAGTRRFNSYWIIGGVLAATLAIAGSGIAATQLRVAELPWTSSNAPAIEQSQPYIRPADRPVFGPIVDAHGAPAFNRPIDNRTGASSENWETDSRQLGRPSDRPQR